MAEKTVRWGVLGCAGIAERKVLPGMLHAENAVLQALSSRGSSEKLKRFAEKFHPQKTYESYEVLLDDPDVDAVYIPLPNGLHCEWVLRAAEKKKHVLCEKPLGVSVEEVRRMKAACDENGVLLMEAFAYRQSPLTQKAKSIVESGALGTVKYIESCYGYNLENEADVRLSAALHGGATYDVGCYNLNLIRYLAGAEPVRVSAFGKVSEKHAVDTESCIMMEFPNGIRAVSYCSLTIFRSHRYLVIGDKGSLTVPTEFNTEGEGKILLASEGKTEELTVDCPDNYRLEIEQFGRAVLGQEPRLISFGDSLGNAEVIEKALKQIQN
ncbi:Gfo/Idh/MocA family oxidoreductase [Clostridium sp. KNHs216]|uniref:Gfo/Idh/MocA family protein n=1 Tax=Clostridium sp. KNHs216 TaxID=1550235 RepID=UPI0011547F87|nr:Gfo/Idh/MocA family oxidoreductase [Clostridium sp. KNHs216]TQI67754.1 putative dehydrogenase [Clostridium sp. KNHs216]